MEKISKYDPGIKESSKLATLGSCSPYKSKLQYILTCNGFEPLQKKKKMNYDTIPFS